MSEVIQEAHRFEQKREQLHAFLYLLFFILPTAIMFGLGFLPLYEGNEPYAGKISEKFAISFLESE